MQTENQNELLLIIRLLSPKCLLIAVWVEAIALRLEAIALSLVCPAPICFNALSSEPSVWHPCAVALLAIGAKVSMEERLKAGG